MTDRFLDAIVAVVDDDERTLKSLQSLLESADYAVRLFASGAAFLESGSIAAIDCLISDISMPGIDGFELSRQVHTARPGLPIILITAQTDVRNHSASTDPGNYRLFRKPFDAEELLRAVDAAVRDRHLRKPKF